MYKTPKETIILSIKEWITADSSSIKSQIFPKLLLSKPKFKIIRKTKMTERERGENSHKNTHTMNR